MQRNRWARRAFVAAGLGLLVGLAIVRPSLEGAEPSGPSVESAEAKDQPSSERRNQEEAMNASGMVEELATNKHGDVDGFTLKDGTVVKFPPHQADELQALVQAGAEVRVAGRRHETPRGDIHLHADKITLTTTGKSVERDERHGPPPPKHGKPGRHGPKDAVPPHEQILAELRSLRKLIESQQK